MVFLVIGILYQNGLVLALITWRRIPSLPLRVVSEPCIAGQPLNTCKLDPQAKLVNLRAEFVNPIRGQPTSKVTNLTRRLQKRSPSS